MKSAASSSSALWRRRLLGSPHHTEEEKDVDFLVERPPREVLDKVEIYIWQRGFHMSLRDRTETTSLFTRIHVPRKGFLKTLLTTLVSTPTAVQKIRLVASEAGEGRTRLTIIESRQGELPDRWTEIKESGGSLRRWQVRTGPSELSRRP